MKKIKMDPDAFIKEHLKLIRTLKSENKEDDATEAEEQQKELLQEMKKMLGKQ